MTATATKRCPRCTRLLRVVIGESFNRKTDSIDGLQPWCRECDAKNKNDIESTDWHCKYCGVHVTYDPMNVVPCCWPCNKQKSNLHPSAFVDWIERAVQRYGRGKVPHDKLVVGIKRPSFPSCAPYVVDDGQIALPFGAEAAE